jgi:hypothetical protein
MTRHYWHREDAFLSLEEIDEATKGSHGLMKPKLNKELASEVC